MSNRVIFELALGCALGIALGVALLYGLVEFADWMVEHTHAIHQ